MPRNPYHLSDAEPTLRKSVFAFMDVLGYSDMIRRSEESGTQEPVLRKLHKALQAGREWLEGRAIPEELRIIIAKDRYALKAFTDRRLKRST